MYSKLSCGFLLLTALVDVTHATYACANNEALNPDKYVDVPEMGSLKCDNQVPQQYMGLLDQGYDKALAEGKTGMALCSFNITGPDGENVTLGDIIRVGSVCCDNPSTVCNMNRMCANPADFDSSVNVSFGDNSECCCSIASSFVSYYGGNCDAPISEGQTIGGVMKVASSTCCSGKATACGKPSSICFNENDFNPDGVFSTDGGNVVTCEQVQLGYNARGGTCDSTDENGTKLETIVKMAATKGCCGSTRLSTCGVGLTTCGNPADFKPDVVVNMGDVNISCANMASYFIHSGSECSGLVPDSGSTYSAVMKMFANQCCGSVNAQTVCDVPLPTLPPRPLTTTAPQSTSNGLNGTDSTTTSPTSGSGRMTMELMSVAVMVAIAVIM